MLAEFKQIRTQVYDEIAKRTAVNAAELDKKLSVNSIEAYFNGQVKETTKRGAGGGMTEEVDTMFKSVLSLVQKVSEQDKIRNDKLQAHVNMLALSKTEAIINPNKSNKQDKAFNDQIIGIHNKAADRFGERIDILESRFNSGGMGQFANKQVLTTS